MLNPTAFLIFQDGTPPPPTPAAPANLALSPASQTVLDVTWDDDYADELNYDLQYDTDPGFGTATEVNPAADATSYSITGLVAGTTYYVRVRAVNPSGDGAWSSDNTTMPGSPPQRLDSVGGYATSISGFRQHWDPDNSDEDYYELEYNSNSSFSGTSVTTTVAAGTLHYDWTGVTPATWYLRARGVSTTLGAASWRGYSANSASGAYDSGFGFVRVPSSIASPPSAPTGVTETVVSPTAVSLGWTEGSGGGFSKTEIVLALDASYNNAVRLAEDAVSAQTEAFTGLAANTTYYYRLRSQDGTNGDFSAWVTGSMLTEPSAVPGAPTGMAVTTTAPTTLDIGWTDPAGAQITEVEAQIAEDIGFVTGLQSDLSVGVGTETKQWTGLTEGTEYYFRVRGVNAAGNGAYDTDFGYTQHAAPTSLGATDQGTNWLLEWTRNSATNTEVQVWRDTGSGFALFDTLGAAEVSYTVVKATGVDWKVLNAGVGADSDFSNTYSDPT